MTGDRDSELDHRVGASADTVERLGRAAIVIVTRNRVTSLLETIERTLSLSESPEIIVVDNASTDATVAAVRAAYPAISVIPLCDNLGAAGRTRGALATNAPLLAFCDDDSYWSPGALRRAAELFSSCPSLGLIAARVLLGKQEQPDPACMAMLHSPIPSPRPLPGPAVLGFIACGAIVRREAYLQVGGFHPRFGVGGEEELLALDLAAAGWDLCYVDSIVAHHHPSPIRDPARRQRIIIRNALWCSWLRRPAPYAIRHTIRVLTTTTLGRSARAGFLEALRGLPWVIRERRPLPPSIEAMRQLVQDHL